MGVAGALTTGSECERQRVAIFGPAVHVQVRLSAHTRRARYHMRVSVRDDGYVPLLQFDWLERGAANEGYPARAVSNHMILDRVLSPGRHLVCNLRTRRCFRDPGRSGGDVEKDGPS